MGHPNTRSQDKATKGSEKHPGHAVLGFLDPAKNPIRKVPHTRKPTSSQASSGTSKGSTHVENPPVESLPVGVTQSHPGQARDQDLESEAAPPSFRYSNPAFKKPAFRDLYERFHRSNPSAMSPPTPDHTETTPKTVETPSTQSTVSPPVPSPMDTAPQTVETPSTESAELHSGAGADFDLVFDTLAHDAPNSWIQGVQSQDVERESIPDPLDQIDQSQQLRQRGDATINKRDTSDYITWEERKFFYALDVNGIIDNVKDYRTITAAIAKLNTVHELYQWTRSYVFKVPFVKLLKGFLIPRQYAGRSRNKGFMGILTYLKADKSSTGKELVRPENPNRAHWSETQWLASCVLEIHGLDTGWKDSLFSEGAYNDDKRYAIIYKIIQKIRNDTALSRRKRLRDKVGLTAEEFAEVKKLASQVPIPADYTPPIQVSYPFPREDRQLWWDIFYRPLPLPVLK